MNLLCAKNSTDQNNNTLLVFLVIQTEPKLSFKNPSLLKLNLTKVYRRIKS